MPLKSDESDEIADYDGDDEAPEAFDEMVDDERESLRCAACGAAIYEQAEQCSNCGHYVVEEERPGRIPLWIIVGTIICILIALLWALRPLPI